MRCEYKSRLSRFVVLNASLQSSNEYDFDRRVLSSISQMSAMDREFAPKPRLAFLGPLGTYSHQVLIHLQLCYCLLIGRTGRVRVLL